MTLPGLHIRRGTGADAAVLAAFAARTFTETYGAHNRPEDMRAHLEASYGVPQQARELADPGMATLLAEHDGVLAGFAQLRRHAPPPCVAASHPLELHRFYVDRPWQGRGLAQALMAAVQQAAHALGATALWLSVWERNPRAIAFYARCGFADVGGTWFFVGPDRQDDRVMLAPVAPPGHAGPPGSLPP
jgi:GNAT superfamily N-acetyltransferase